jgi:hypothetical protein
MNWLYRKKRRMTIIAWKYHCVGKTITKAHKPFEYQFGTSVQDHPLRTMYILNVVFWLVGFVAEYEYEICTPEVVVVKCSKWIAIYRMFLLLYQLAQLIVSEKSYHVQRWRHNGWYGVQISYSYSATKPTNQKTTFSIYIVLSGWSCTLVPEKKHTINCYPFTALYNNDLSTPFLDRM